MSKACLEFILGEEEKTILCALEDLKERNIIGRIWQGDHTVWKPLPDNIANRLGWLCAPEETLRILPYIQAVIHPLLEEGIDEIVLVGMGGSSLAASVFQSMLNGCGNRRLQILDTTDPATIGKAAHRLNWEKTLFVVSSKSGTTLETIFLFNYFYGLAQQKWGSAAGRRFLVITDDGSHLVSQAEKLSLRHVFSNSKNIGGRYSALTPVGIVPAALIGIDVKKMLQRAVVAAEGEKARHFSGRLADTGAVLGAVLGSLAKSGRNKPTFIFPPSWRVFGDWLEQLIAESLGKEGLGVLPVLDEEPASSWNYRWDRVFVFFGKENDSWQRIKELGEAGHPSIFVRIGDGYDIGRQMFMWEMATAVAGHVLGVNPFDQPDVEKTKIHTRRLLSLRREHSETSGKKPTSATEEYFFDGGAKCADAAKALTDFINSAKEAEYVCLQAYLSLSPELEKELQKLKAAIFCRWRIAVTTGYGPRYLHSTGQLHKGDAGKGLFIQIISSCENDINIPEGERCADSALTFGKLKLFQAEADGQALVELNRRVFRLHLKNDTVAVIQSIAACLTQKTDF